MNWVMRGSGAVLFTRRELRRRAAAFVGLALIVAIGVGVTIGSLVAAYRTDRVYDAYVREAQVTDLVVNPSLPTAAAAAVVRNLPGVLSVHADSLLTASVQHTEPVPVQQLFESDQQLQVLGPTDGRYVEVDRPVITDGHVARGEREVFVTNGYRSQLEDALRRRVRVGDTITVAFWQPDVARLELPPDTIIEPIGVEQLRVVGFGDLPDEVLPDELYPRQRLVVSPDVARRYSCAGDLRPDMTEEQAVAAVYPADCARSYEYFALDLEDRPGNRAGVRRGFAQAERQLTQQIPRQLREEGLAYGYISQDRTDVDRAVRQVTRPTVTALWVFGLVAGIATLTIVALAIARILRRNDPEQRALRAMGASRGGRTTFAVMPPLVAVVIGLVGALLIGFATSIFGPAGSVRSVVPSAGFALPGRVVLPTIMFMVVALGAISAALAWSAAKRASRMVEGWQRPSWTSRTLAHRGRPAVSQGVSAAFSTTRSNGAVALVAGCVVAVAAVMSAVVFVTNLTTLVQDQDRYGWPWDVAVLTNGGYSDTDPVAVGKSLKRNKSVQDYAMFTFDPANRIANRPTATIYGFPGAERTQLPLVRGRQAQRAGEAVLGTSTADELGVEPGDRVPVDGFVPGLESIEVVGVAVLPSLGSFLADRTGPGTGAFVLIDIDPANPDYEYPAALTAIRLRGDADATTFVAGIQPALRRWSIVGQPPQVHTKPVRPPEIINAESMQAAPLVLGGLLALGLAIGLAWSIGVSVRDRRRELAVLRSLGFSGRDLRATVAWQAIATITVGLVVGIPLGLVGGRYAWESFAHQLGVVPSAEISVAWIAAVIAGSLLVALLAAWSPARSAARIAPSAVFSEAP